MSTDRINGNGAPAGDVILRVEGLRMEFPMTAGVLRRRVGTVHAVEDVWLELRRNETLAIVGESGSGKTTVGRIILRLIDPTAGAVIYEDRDVTRVRGRELKRLRRHLQVVFQDPYASLNPRMTAVDIIADPLITQGTRRGEAHARARELLSAVGLEIAHGRRFPHEFSGGQRQRIGIARALALNPSVVVLDEPVSALDVSVQGQILNLLSELQEGFGLSYLLISHNLAVVRHVAHRVAVMYAGRVVESAPAEALYRRPQHPYTHALLSAVPVPDPDVERRRRHTLAESDLPSPLRVLPGCCFQARCPLAQDVCRTDPPALVEHERHHLVACHFPTARQSLD